MTKTITERLDQYIFDENGAKEKTIYLGETEYREFEKWHEKQGNNRFRKTFQALKYKGVFICYARIEGKQTTENNPFVKRCFESSDYA